mgnify:CR=1 FL=1
MSDAEPEELDQHAEDSHPSNDEQGSDDDRECDAEAEAALKKSGSKKGKKRLNLVNDFGKARGRAKDGKKYCAPCGKWLPLDQFPSGSAQRGEDRKALQNLKNAAVAQQQGAWWDEVTRDPKKLRDVVKKYKQRVPPPGKKRKEPFMVLQYIEERRQEQAVLLDGVLEMMTERAFVVWMAKPKNGCMDPEEAKREWKKKLDAPGAIVDEKGPNARYCQRVAVNKADLVVFRDASIKSQGYVGKDKEVKKASQEDVDRAEARLSKDPTLAASSARSSTDQAASLVAAAAAGDDGAFSSEGKAAMQLGDIKDLMSDAEDQPPSPSERVTPQKPSAKRDSDACEDSSKKPSSKKKAKKEAWFDRDAAVASALKGHQAWIKNTKLSIQTTMEGLKQALDKVTPEVEEEVKNESKLAKNRLYALKLIMGTGVGKETGTEVSTEVGKTVGEEKKQESGDPKPEDADKEKSKEEPSATPPADPAPQAPSVLDRLGFSMLVCLRL